MDLTAWISRWLPEEGLFGTTRAAFLLFFVSLFHLVRVLTQSYRHLPMAFSSQYRFLHISGSRWMLWQLFPFFHLAAMSPRRQDTQLRGFIYFSVEYRFASPTSTAREIALLTTSHVEAFSVLHSLSLTDPPPQDTFLP